MAPRLYNRLHRLSLWILALTAFLALIGLFTPRHGIVLRASSTNEIRLFLSPIDFGGLSVRDKGGTCIPFLVAGEMNKNIIRDASRDITVIGGALAHYRVAEYPSATGGVVTITNWRLTYIPQVVLALILPIAGLVGRTRRFWPLLGIWEQNAHAINPGRRVFNAMTVLSLLVCFSTLAIWSIAFFLRGALPSIATGYQRELWFEKNEMTLMVVFPFDAATIASLKQTHPGENGPWYRATRIQGVPYWWIILLASAMPAARGALSVTNRRRKLRRSQVDQCPACGYDLRMSENRCPECGQAFARKTVVVAVANEQIEAS